MSESVISELTSERYETSVCREPFCGCYVLRLNSPGDANAVTKLDCMRQEVLEVPDDGPLSKAAIEQGLSRDDWTVLLDLFTGLRWELLEKYPADQLVNDQFDFYQIQENGLLVWFYEIFPSLGCFVRRHDGRRVIIMDSYCIRSGCECGEATLDLAEIDEHGDNQQPIASVDLDLNTMKWKRQTNVRNASGLPFLPILAAFLAEPGCRERLRKRQRTLHETYVHSMDQFAPVPEAPFREETTPGRNEPCPCGSGKKYKKCCARK